MLRDDGRIRSYVLSLGATAGAVALCGAYQESHHDVVFWKTHRPMHVSRQVQCFGRVEGARA